MKINEIFCSLNGESARAGKRTVFVRTFGCNLRCSYCDTMYAVEGKDYTDMTIEEIKDKVDSFHCTRVTLTGGEPMLQKDMMDLIYLLDGDCDRLYELEVETNGAVDLTELVKARKNGDISDSLLITMDWKCQTSDMLDKMIENNLSLLSDTDVVKCVVGSIADLEEAMRVHSLTQAQLYLSPVFGKIEPKEIAEYINAGEINDVTMQLQQHKFIWPIDMRGV